MRLHRKMYFDISGIKITLSTEKFYTVQHAQLVSRSKFSDVISITKEDIFSDVASSFIPTSEEVPQHKT